MWLTKDGYVLMAWKIWKPRKSMHILAIALMSLFLAISCFVNPVRANAPPLPQMNWFTLTQTSGHKTLQGLQIVECSDAKCDRPVLVVQYGECRDTGCLTNVAQASSRGERLDCFDDRCLLVDDILNSFPINEPPSKEPPKPLFRMIGQFSDRVRMSPPIPKNTSVRYKNENLSFPSNGSWQVEVTDDAMRIVQNADKDSYSFGSYSPFQEYKDRIFWRGWLLTILSELLIAAIYMWWRKTSFPLLWKILLAIVMVNLFSYPVVWSFFPSLEPFQSAMTRYFGISSLAIALLFGLTMQVDPPASSSKLVFSALTIFIGGNILGGFISILCGYGRWDLFAQGIPYRFAMPASEVFAIVYEAWVISSLSQRQLSFAQASLISLLTNLTSLSLGIIILR
ncbi:hypothetical protein [Pseudanabaena sp. UWO310]|uniref:hypothetical protein n=1 Tax=Pseudanabaena sp. UWO310 TaxID=2480795 RepID=UPI0011595FA8|nr:hypothetical protein [Pseudanabaena sp. UWO310]TYQ29854.1 hypothetical protein PseudUWO310_11675 [Pseudanabaena sp. UWO310]